MSDYDLGILITSLEEIPFEGNDQFVGNGSFASNFTVGKMEDQLRKTLCRILSTLAMSRRLANINQKKTFGAAYLTNC